LNSGVRATTWCLCVNNPSERDAADVLNRFQEKFGNRLIALGAWQEEAPTTGTIHWHIVVHLSSRTTRSCLCNLIPGCDCEPCRSTLQLAIGYAAKHNNPVVLYNMSEREIDQCINIWRRLHSNENTQELGITTETSLMIKGDEKTLSFIKLCQSGATPTEVQELFPMLYLRFRMQADGWIIGAQVKKGIRTWNGQLNQKNFWIWGAAGIGKTRWVENLHQHVNGPLPIFNKTINKWWCGFDPSFYKIVLINDWVPGHGVLATHLLGWADRYACAAEVKGGQIVIVPGCFFLFVTSNYRIRDCFPDEDIRKSMERRFQEVQFFPGIEFNEYPTPEILMSWRDFCEGNNVVIEDQQVRDGLRPPEIPQTDTEEGLFSSISELDSGVQTQEY
jgi:hypothetical protein